MKTVLIFSKYFLSFWFDTIENQSIKNFSLYKRKIHASVDLGDSKVTILWEGRDTAFCPSLRCILFTYCIVKLKK